MNSAPLLPDRDDECTTAEVARRLGLAVRSVQLMVDRGELQAWKTPGGHRRVSRRSVEDWLARRMAGTPALAPSTPADAAGPSALPAAARAAAAGRAPRVLLIEDSRHYQNLIRLLMEQQFPHAEFHAADDGYAGLALAGRLEPDVLLVDILLPGMDGAMLIASLRKLPFFTHSHVVVVTSLDEEERRPFQHALQGVPVIHKARLMVELPPLLEPLLQASGAALAS
ncbi:response regulator [Inhella proteolytica]|uniref:response regulator n=1 Tax=Inhella proteolytica TaxID=2795029 RepID=UPI002873AC64|nr:response regulator [Inhella proteolytica]